VAALQTLNHLGKSPNVVLAQYFFRRVFHHFDSFHGVRPRLSRARRDRRRSASRRRGRGRLGLVRPILNLLREHEWLEN